MKIGAYSVLGALTDSPIVLIYGARQTGKTALAEQLTAGPYPARYLTLDDAALLADEGRSFHNAAVSKFFLWKLCPIFTRNMPEIDG